MGDRPTCKTWLRLAAASLALVASAGRAQNVSVQTVTLDGSAQGKRFDGIGVVEGGGATSVLLKDYPEPQRSQILDLLFKPKFGASVSALYVEVPGDGNSTQGSMSSHAHFRGDANFWRGYLWWTMREARRRNPSLSLDGAAWSAPGWIGTQGEIYDQDLAHPGDANFFSQDMVGYYVQWLRGLREVHHLELDALGSRNEKGVSYGFARALRRALDANGFQSVKLHGFDNWPDDWKFDFVKDMREGSDLARTLDVISAHINAPKSIVPREVQVAAERLRKPIWNTEQHVYIAGFDGLIGIVEAFNENFIRSGVSKVVNWYGIAALYPMEPYSGEKEAAVRASWPWSGHYSINPALWAYAHYGQFSQIGWHYLDHASGDLAGGGTYVTLKSPGDDYSVIIETKGALKQAKLRLVVERGLSSRPLAVWKSTRRAQFERQADLAPVEGAFELTLEPDAVYSLTTTRGQRKGGFSSVPAGKSFPFPYRETFDGYRIPQRFGYLPRYFADISGAFELAPCPGRTGGCLHQVVPAPTISWAPDWKPYTILGDENWRDYEISADVYLAAGEAAAVMGRINHVGTGYGFIPKGYFLQLGADGDLRLVVSRGKVQKKALVGDAEQQAIIKAQNDSAEGGEKLLGAVRVTGVAPRRWRRLTLRFEGSKITGLVDGTSVLVVNDNLYSSGMAGLLAAPRGAVLSMPFFDDVVVKNAGKANPAATGRGPRRPPIYPAAR